MCVCVYCELITIIKLINISITSFHMFTFVCLSFLKINLRCKAFVFLFYSYLWDLFSTIKTL